jgi:hypothetical protein
MKNLKEYSTRNMVRGALAAGLLTAALPPLSLLQTAAAQPPISVVLNGQVINFGGAAPTQVGGRVLVPLRGVFESLGATVNYDAATSTIFATRGDTKMQLRLGSTEASINGQTSYLDVPAQARNGRTLVPLRFVSETLGATVSWSEPQHTVYITEAGRAPGTGGPGTDMANNNVPPPPVADNTYYPPADVPANRVATIFGTVTRNLPGERSFEMQSDNGTVLRVRPNMDEPARLSRGDRVEVRGQYEGDIFVADTVRVTSDTAARRTRVTGTVESVRSATRLTMRDENDRIITVVTATPFPATITEGDSIRAVGSLNGTIMNAERVVLLTDRPGETATGRPVSFNATVESVDAVARTLQVRGDNGVAYVIRFNGAGRFAPGDLVRIVGTSADGITTATNVTLQ